jgi:hypothetical protein
MPDSRSSQLERRALALVRDAVPASVQVGIDAHLELPDGTTTSLQFVRWLGPNGPTRRSRPERDPSLVWIAPRVSAAQRRQWRDRNENFVDLSGAVRLVLPGLVIDRTDLSPARPAASDRITSSRNPFADRASLVVRAMLEAPGKPWSTTVLAKAAGVSIPTVSLVAEGLRRLGLLSPPTGRRGAMMLDDPAAVIVQWSRRYDWRQNASVAFAAPIGHPDQFLRRLAATLGSSVKRRRWALTLQAGASLIAPHAHWDIFHAYVDAEAVDDLLEIGSLAGWPVSPTGRLVLMRPRYRTSVWYHSEKARGLPVVSRTQLVLDLWHYPVRGLEQAEFIMQRSGWDRPHAEQRVP